MPSWFVSSWSKILRASTSCDVLAPLVPFALADVPVVPVDGAVDGVVAGGAAVDGIAVDGIAVDGAEPGDGVAVVGAPLDGDVACASVVSEFDEVEVVSEVVAHAAPAIVMMAAAAAVTSCRCKALMAVPFSMDDGTKRRR
jgi:hypothetical protein